MTEKTALCVSDTTVCMVSKYQNARTKRTNKATIDAWGLPAGMCVQPEQLSIPEHSPNWTDLPLLPSAGTRAVGQIKENNITKKENCLIKNIRPYFLTFAFCMFTNKVYATCHCYPTLAST